MNKHMTTGLLITSLLLGACATPREQDPTWQRLNEVDGRVLRIERVINNQSLLELSQRDDSLQSELRTLRGQLEQLQHSVETARSQQRDLFADMDKRVLALEAARSAAPAAANATTPGVSSNAPGYGNASAVATDKDAYQAAFALLKEGKYAEAATGFSQFLDTYSQSPLLDNAQYWLGEAHYVLKDYPQAQRDFQTVLDKYPTSGKTPDALLKLGYTHYEVKNFKEARRALQRVVDQYADSSAARLAQQRLAKMTSEGH